MKKRILVMAALAIITLGLAIPLSAQSVTSATTVATSNQSRATAGVFGTDVDNYMHVNYYGDVNFNKWFGYLGTTSTATPFIFNLGYATMFGGGGGDDGEGSGGGGIYLGTFYTGNIFTSDKNETTRLNTTWDPVLQQLTIRVDEKQYTRTYTDTNNNIAALVGLTGLNMGIKLGFYENMRVYNTPYNANRATTQTTTTNQDGSITHTNNDSLSYEEKTGSMVPYVEWGMQLKIGSNTLAPRAGLGVVFYENKLIDKYYASGRTEFQGKIIGREDIERRGFNSGYTGLNIGAGADYYLNDKMYVGLDYSMLMYLYDQSFGDAGRKGSVKGTISWNNNYNYTYLDTYFDRTVKEDSVQIEVTERNYMRHIFTPAFWTEKAVGENVRFGVLVKLPVTIRNESSTVYTDRWQTTVVDYIDENDKQNNTTTVINTHTANAGNKSEISYLNIAPTVGVGVSCDLTPKFTVNAGINVNVPSFNSTNTVLSRDGIGSTYTKTETGYGDNKYTSLETLSVDQPTTIADSVANESHWTAFNGTSFRGGFVLNFNDNFALDMVCTSATYSITLTTVNVLFSIKF